MTQQPVEPSPTTSAKPFNRRLLAQGRALPPGGNQRAYARRHFLTQERIGWCLTAAVLYGIVYGARLVFANGLARLVLTSGEIPDWWGDKPMGLIIAEGEPDFLSNATIYSDADEDAPMVLGIGSGWWTDELASRIPKNTRVIIRTHEDEAGDNWFGVHISPHGALGSFGALRRRCRASHPVFGLRWLFGLIDGGQVAFGPLPESIHL